MSRLLRVLRYVSLLILVVTSTVAMTLVFYLHGSLPKLDGTLIVPGLRAKVEIERDTQGIPTLSAIHREDIAFGLGFLHAQERFFQMDLQRREAAGETAELLGSRALIADRSARRHNFRTVARGALAEASIEQVRLLESYTRGVNQGLSQLRQEPTEYLLLGESPRAWLPEDSLLVMLNQYQVLHDNPTDQLLHQHHLTQALPAEWRDFLAAERHGDTEPPLPDTPLRDLLDGTESATVPLVQTLRPGGNQWAVSGDRTYTGRAFLATDLHLPQSLPNQWFRAQWRMPGTNRLVSGLTLPGSPVMMMGSNEQVSWSFTPAPDSGARLIRLETDGDLYATANGWRPFRERQERIAVQGSTIQHLTVRDTQWGPVVGQDSSGQWLALDWSAHEPSGIDVALIGLEAATDLETALASVSDSMPAQYLFVADHTGRIAAQRRGALAHPALESDRMARQLLDGASLNLSPRLNGDRAVHTDQPLLWRTETQHVTTGDDMRENPELPGWRDRQVQAALSNGNRLATQDLLDLQLDTDALWLRPWVAHLTDQLAALDPPVGPSDQQLATVRTLLASTEHWRADPDSAAYALVRRYYDAIKVRTLGPLMQALDTQRNQRTTTHLTEGLDQNLLRLIQNADEQHLPPRFDSWTDLFADAAEEAIAFVFAEATPPTWGDQNPTRFVHPLADRVPGLSHLLNITGPAAPGDAHTVRVQYSGVGAAMRMVVSPGAETDSVLHMPGSQSSHPFSPYFRLGHSDWVEGNRSPFLASDTQYHMTLIPQR